MGFFYSHHKQLSLSEVAVDPIVFPGIIGEYHGEHDHWHGPHAHDFAGRFGINENSTPFDLQNQPSSGPESKGGTYWMPALYVNGEHVTPDDVAARYGRGSAATKNPSRFIPFPQGMGIVSTRSPKYVFWNVEHPPSPSAYKSWDTVPADPTRRTTCAISFPDWWTGRDPGIPDWSHECGYSVKGQIPDGAWALPALKLIVHYEKFVPPIEAKLSSGAPATMHADFFNTWDPDELQKAFDIFLKGNATTGEIGRAKQMLS